MIIIKQKMPVKVQLATTMTQDGQQDHFEFSESGEFINLNGKYYLRYLEHQNGAETPVQFRLDEGAIHLHRQGATETRLKFDLSQPTITHYRTEYGMIQLQVLTSELTTNLDPLIPAGRLTVAYELHAGEQLIGSYRLELQFSA